jgi:hypothetical protein
VLLPASFGPPSTDPVSETLVCPSSGVKPTLRSKDAFLMRRAQIILASNRGERASLIARSLGCGSQTVRDAIHDFNERGLAALVAGSSRPKRTRAAFDESTALSP